MYNITNEKMPRIRRDAVVFARKHGVRRAARYFGFSPGAIVLWKKKADSIGLHPIPTKSSRPKHHAQQLSDELVWKIFHTRLKVKRSAEVIHRILHDEGTKISLSSVKRTLDRSGLLKKRSPWKRYHPHVDRPLPEMPGSLVQIDTIHTMIDKKRRIYTLTLIDIHSRWTYAKTYPRMNAVTAVHIVEEAQSIASFHFEMIQSDHGPEFGTWFVEHIQKKYRYWKAQRQCSYRTVQPYLAGGVFRQTRANTRVIQYRPEDIPPVVQNNKRYHFGLELQTPLHAIKCSQAIDEITYLIDMVGT